MLHRICGGKLAFLFMLGVLGLARSYHFLKLLSLVDAMLARELRVETFLGLEQAGLRRVCDGAAVARSCTTGKMAVSGTAVLIEAYVCSTIVSFLSMREILFFGRDKGRLSDNGCWTSATKILFFSRKRAIGLSGRANPFYG